MFEATVLESFFFASLDRRRAGSCTLRRLSEVRWAKACAQKLHLSGAWGWTCRSRCPESSFEADSWQFQPQAASDRGLLGCLVNYPECEIDLVVCDRVGDDLFPLQRDYK